MHYWTPADPTAQAKDGSTPFELANSNKALFDTETHWQLNQERFE